MPLFLHRTESSGLHTGIWQLDEAVSYMKERVILTPEEESAYSAFSHEARKRQWLGVRMLLKEMFPDKCFQITYDENEKPFIRNSDWKISISHSRNLAAVVMHPLLACGTDIEHIHARIEKVAEKFLSPEETKFLSGTQYTEKLHVCWGIKESLYKMAGWPGMIFAEDMMIKPFEFSVKGCAEACIIKEKDEKWYSLSYEKVNDYLLVTTMKK